MNNDIGDDSSPSKLAPGLLEAQVKLKCRLIKEAADNDDFESAARFQSEVKQLEAQLNTQELGSRSNVV